MWFRGNRGATAHHSLRQRLLWLVLAAIALAGALQAATAWRLALRTADELFDQHLQEVARSVEGGLPFAGTPESYDFAVQVWTPDGVQIFRSRGLALPSQPEIGFSDTVVDGTRYRVYQLRSPRRIVQVAQDLDARDQRARSLAWEAALRSLVLAPLLMVALWLLIDRSLRPIERMRKEVAARPAQDFSPLPEDGLPREVLPLVRELNGLFERARQAFESQRHFVADAAHELRSPLAALKLQVQAIERHADPSQAEALLQLREGMDRAIALVSQLLSLARAEAEHERPGQPVELQAVCREAVSAVWPLAQDRRIDLGLRDATEATVAGDPDLLGQMLRNLLENALKYTPPGGQVDIVIVAGPPVRLIVEDSGPGIAPEDRERVFDRFHRAAPADVEGSGLGLAIVRAIARRHGASVHLDRSQRLGGLAVEVRFDSAGDHA